MCVVMFIRHLNVCRLQQNKSLGDNKVEKLEPKRNRKNLVKTVYVSYVIKASTIHNTTFGTS